MTNIKIVLDWFPNTNHTGLLLARDRGYFKAAGLNVEIGGDVHGALSLHGADAVCGPMISMLEQMDAGMPITAVATFTQKCDSGIVSLRESGIVSPKDLEGKRLTHWTPEWFHLVISEAMRLDGGDYGKVRLVPMDVGDIVSTLGHAADATWVYANWENQELLQAGREINYIALADFHPLFDFPAPSIAFTHAFLRDHPSALRAFLAAADMGYRDAVRDPSLVLQLRDALPSAPDELLLRSQRHLSPILLDARGRWGRIEPARWDRMADFLVERGLIRARRPNEFTNAFLPGGDA